MTPTPTPKTPLFPFRLELEAEAIVICRAPGVEILRGVVVAVALPVLLLVTGALLAIGTGRDWIGNTAGALGAFSVLVGVAMIASAWSRAARNGAILDLRRRVLRIGRVDHPLDHDGPTTLAFDVRATGSWGRAVLEARIGVTATAPLQHFWSAHRADVTELAVWLTAAASAPLPDYQSLRRARIAEWSTPERAATGCFPLVAIMQGLEAPKGSLMRFSSVQSLTQTAVFCALMVVSIALAVQLEAGSVAVAVAVGALFLANVAALSLAAGRVSRGNAWVIPWLRPIARRFRWAPELLNAFPT